MCVCFSIHPLSSFLIECILLGVECLCAVHFQQSKQTTLLSYMYSMCVCVFVHVISTAVYSVSELHLEAIVQKCRNPRHPKGRRTEGRLLSQVSTIDILSAASVVAAVSSTVGWPLKLECCWLEII